MTAMNTDGAKSRRRIGRPLSFDRPKALRQAMLLFWRHGYESTSLSQLTAAMGVTPPSIYAAFGDKKRLFMEAVSLYTSGPVTSASIIDGASTARGAAEGLLKAAAIGFTGPGTPPGCLLASSAISCSSEALGVQKKLASIRRRIEARLTDRITAGLKNGEPFLEGVEPGDLAAYVMALIQGMSTLARDGASTAKLLRIVDTAMQAWPC